MKKFIAILTLLASPACALSAQAFAQAPAASAPAA
jgi:hypothetical protein